jgi:hypothetical protein
MNKMTRPYLINLSKISDLRGNLTFIQYPDHIPFEIKKVDWIYDVPSGRNKIGYASKKNKEVIVCLSGSIEVFVTNGQTEESYVLSRPYSALVIPKMNWRQLRNFSTNAVVMILNSSRKEESEMIHDFSKLLK